jgi:hypothetical protein
VSSRGEGANDPAGSPAQYANYIEVGYNAFEFLLHLGQTFAGESPHIHTRIIASPAHARSFCDTLTKSLGRYEAAYGPIPQDEEE